jgi:hypothetical protein
MTKTLKQYVTAAAVVTSAAVASFLLVTGLAYRAEARGAEAAAAAIEPLPATGPHVAAWALAVEAPVAVTDAGAEVLVPPPVVPPAQPAIVAGEPVNETIELLASPVDPVGDPAGTLDVAITWWKAGWFKPLGILVAFVALTLLSLKVPWLRVGYRLAATTIAIDALGDLLARLATGVPLTFPLAMASATAAVLVFLRGKAPAALDGSSASGGKSGGVAAEVASA